MTGHTVIIVEDEWLVRMELVAAFEDEGYAIVECASAEDAIVSLREQGDAIDLLITDIRLTGALTGWDIASEARAIWPDIAVIYVSANPPAAEREVAGSVFIDKPALVDRVIAEAGRLLARD